jgi:hypothetical protein
MLQTVDMCPDRLDGCTRLSCSCDLDDCPITLHVIQESICGDLKRERRFWRSFNSWRTNVVRLGETANGWRCLDLQAGCRAVGRTASKGACQGEGASVSLLLSGAFGGY